MNGLPHWSQIPVLDADAAEMIGRMMPGMIHYAPVTQTWYAWDGRCHRPDDSSHTGRLITGIASQMLEYVNTWQRREEAAEGAAKRHLDTAGKYWAHVRRSAGHSGVARMLGIERGVSPDAMAEQHPGWLNVANGTLDLATLELRPHDPHDMITYCVDAAWDAGARAPMFWGLLSRMCGGVQEVAWYLLKALGYGLLGENPEQVAFFINGPTKSGKSQLLYVVRALLGMIAHESQADLITVVRHGRNARTENSVRGMRFVSITETSAFMHIDEGQFKRLTGEPVISVDQHYAKTELKTPVTFTIYVATNEMPSLTNFDDAMAERIIVIPGGRTIPEHERDRHLAEKILRDERAGVLAMLAKGCAEYTRSGLVMPHAVRDETAKYRARQNTVAAFIEDMMVRDPSGVLSVTAPEAWGAYQRWSRAGAQLGRNEFYEAMSREPGVAVTGSATHSKVFRGIGLNG